MLVRLALSKDALKTKSPTAARMPHAMRWTCSSLSMTHGPAINTSGRPAPNAAKSIGTGEQRLLFDREIAQMLAVGRADECLEQRMRLHRLGLEFGMELAAEEPRVLRHLTDLHVLAVRRLSRNAQPRRRQLRFVFAVEFVPVTVPLVNVLGPVGLAGEASALEPARPAPQPHRPAHFVHALQFAELVDDAVLRDRK